METSGWYYEVGNERRGPFALAELQAMVKGGRVTRQTRVWAEGLKEAVPAGTLAVLFGGAPVPADPSLKYLLPVGRSGFAIAAGYLGLFGIAVPFLCIAAVIFSILGARDLKRNPEKLGWGRVITGFVLGIPMSLIWIGILVAGLLKN